MYLYKMITSRVVTPDKKRRMSKTHSAPLMLPQFQADQCNFRFSQAVLQFTSCNIIAELTKYKNM